MPEYIHIIENSVFIGIPISNDNPFIYYGPFVLKDIN
jgi:hypothetical protein